MGWSLWTSIAVVAGGLVAFFIVELIYLSIVLSWEDRATRGLGYYGLPPAGRRRFKRLLRIHAVLLYPILRLMSRLSRFSFQKTNFQHRGLAGPKGTCSEESFARADEYQPQSDDVFVVTQMKCGTTWMQHVVYEVLRRGMGDIVDSGTTMYAVSPWLEALKSVSLEEAPRIGTERPSRVIKTQLPASHCPFSAEAKYVYVARHPVSCYASCADFIAANVGAFAPSAGQVEEWFRSNELMWWGTWAAHVKGWWELSQQHENVLFVYFEEMKRDLAAVVGQVAAFLDMRPLADSERQDVVRKCGFDYMQRHDHAFEMHPPHILAVDAELFVSGKADRHRDVPADARRRILAWCARELAESSFPMSDAYPDVVS